MLLSKILSHLEGQGVLYGVGKLIDTEISNAAIPENSNDGSVLFFNSDVPKEFNFPYGACFIHEDKSLLLTTERNVISVRNPRLAMVLIAQLLKPYFTQTESTISKLATIHPNAQLGKNVVIMPGANIGKAIIGDYTIIHPNAVIYDDVEIGAYCHIGANATIGDEGLGAEMGPVGGLFKFPHFAGVVIKDKVHIGPNTVIASGVLKPTIIETGCLIDAAVHIGHNAHIHQYAEIVAGCVICGSVTVGKDCFLGASSIIRNHIELESRIKVGMGAVVTKTFSTPMIVLIGNPARVMKIKHDK